MPMKYRKGNKPIGNVLKNIKTATKRIAANPWIVFIVLMGVVLVTCHGKAKQKKTYEHKIECLADSISSMRSTVDSLECLQRIESVVIMKAGEFAVRPRCHETEFTVDSAASLLVEIGAWYPDIKLAQYQCESGLGKSTMAKGAKNIGGMRATRKRPTTQIKNSDWNGYGMYNNWESFIIDHVLWDQSVFGCKKPSRAEYISTLDRIYGGNGDYGQVMDKESRKYQKLFVRHGGR